MEVIRTLWLRDLGVFYSRMLLGGKGLGDCVRICDRGLQVL
jgi:hypothetical protein